MEFRKPEWSLYFRDIDIYLSKLSNEDAALVISTLDRERWPFVFAFHTSKGKWQRLDQAGDSLPQYKANDPMKYPKLPTKALGPYLQPSQKPPEGQKQVIVKRKAIPPEPKAAPVEIKPEPKIEDGDIQAPVNLHANMDSQAARDLPGQPISHGAMNEPPDLSVNLTTSARQSARRPAPTPKAPPLILQEHQKQEAAGGVHSDALKRENLSAKRQAEPDAFAKQFQSSSAGSDQDDDEPFEFSAQTFTGMRGKSNSVGNGDAALSEGGAGDGAEGAGLSDGESNLPAATGKKMEDEKTVVDMDFQSAEASTAKAPSDGDRRGKRRASLIELPADFEVQFIALNEAGNWTAKVTHLGFPDVMLETDLPTEFPDLGECYLDTAEQMFELTFQVGRSQENPPRRNRLYFLPSTHFENLNAFYIGLARSKRSV